MIGGTFPEYLGEIIQQESFSSIATKHHQNFAVTPKLSVTWWDHPSSLQNHKFALTTNGNFSWYRFDWWILGKLANQNIHIYSWTDLRHFQMHLERHIPSQ
jgi:hypothetical protein